MTILETDDDDGTGNGHSGVIDSQEASVIAGLALPAAGTYYVRISAKTPSGVIAPYVLMVGTSLETVSEIEPNDTESQANWTMGVPVAGALSSASDVDWYRADHLDSGPPFVILDGDPERDGLSTQVVFDFGFPGMPQVNSSTGQGAPPPAAEGACCPSSTP